jgi:hypothetical protein
VPDILAPELEQGRKGGGGYMEKPVKWKIVILFLNIQKRIGKGKFSTCWKKEENNIMIMI